MAEWDRQLRKYFGAFVNVDSSPADGDLLRFNNTSGHWESADVETAALEAVYPVGAVYLSYVSTSPSTLGFPGTWLQFAEGRMLVGFDTSDADFNSIGETGGSKTKNLQHSHTTPFGWDGGNYYAYSNGSNHPVYGAPVVAGVNRASFSQGSHSTGSARLAETSDDGDSAQDVMNPYITVYMWRRSA